MKKIQMMIMVACLGILPVLHAQKDKKLEVIKLTTEEFLKKVYNYNEGDKAVYLGKTPAIVDFYADWCRPCKMLSPILDELLNEYKGKIIVYKVDVDQEKELAGKMGVTAMPTLYFFPKKGTPVRTIGFQDKAALKEIIDKYLFE